MIPPTWYVIAGMAVALGGVSYLAYDAIEDKGRLAATIEAKDKAIAKLGDDLKRQERETQIRQSITDAADRAVVSVETGRDMIRTKTQVIFHEVQRAQDCHDPVGPALRLAFDRLRELDREARADRRDASGGAGPAGSPAQGAAPPRGAVTNCAAGEYLVRLYEWGRGLEGQIGGIGAWVGEAKAVRTGETPATAGSRLPSER